MNTLQAHKALQAAIDLMDIVSTDTSKALVLELLAAYNAIAINNPDCYTQLKNAGNSKDIWIIAA